MNHSASSIRDYFIYGPHFCLGARLARIEMAACFGALLSFPHLSLDEAAPAVRKHHSLAFSGFETLPLRLDSRAVTARGEGARSRSGEAADATSAA